MTKLTTVHDTKTGEPKRIHYNGDMIDAGFNLTNEGVAELDSLRTIEVDDHEAYVDLEEFRYAVSLVEQMDAVEYVEVMGDDDE